MPPLNQGPETSQPTIAPQSAERHAVGPIAGAIIVILLLIAGGLYFWGAQLSKQQAQPEVPVIQSNDTSYTQSEGTLTSDTSAGLPPQSSSDDISSIEADLNAMNMDQLESQNSAELNNI